MSDTPLGAPPLPSAGSATLARVDVAAAFHRLRLLSGVGGSVTDGSVTDVVDGMVDVLVPAIADACTVDLAAPVAAIAAGEPVPARRASASAATVMVRAAGELRVSFSSTVNLDFGGTVSCRWTDGHLPSPSDISVLLAVVDQCVLLADRVHLSEGLQQLQVHAGQLRTAVESNRRIGAAVGVLMVRYGLTEERAFDALRRTSNTSNRKLRDVADDVLFTGSLPGRSGSLPPAAAQPR